MRTAPTGRGAEVVEVGQPDHCPHGHQLAGNMLVGFLPCACQPTSSGHRTYRCKTCGVTVYLPEHDLTVLPPPR